MEKRPTPRLSSPERKQQILRVAARIFSRKGYQGTTTREIASAAGVNEAILFRHFPTKGKLYWGVIDSMCQNGRRPEELKRRLYESRSTREMFALVARDILDRQDDPTFSRLLFFSALENHHLSSKFFRTYIARRYEVLAANIRERIQKGEFRDVDPLLAARGFLGMVVYHFLIQDLFGAKRYQQFDRQTVCDTFADLWLAGVSARAGRNRRRKKVSKS